MSKQYPIDTTDIPYNSYKPRPSDVPAGMIRDNARRVQTGMIRGASVVRFLIAFVRVLAWILIALSLIGTFYAILNKAMPLTEPLIVFFDVWDHWILGVLALILQGFLTMIQWAAAKMAKDGNPYWWLAYLGALAFSIWLNWQAYGDPLIALHTPWLLAFIIVAGADIAPEHALLLD